MYIFFTTSSSSSRNSSSRFVVRITRRLKYATCPVVPRTGESLMSIWSCWCSALGP